MAAMPALNFAAGTEIVIRRQTTGGTDVMLQSYLRSRKSASTASIRAGLPALPEPATPSTSSATSTRTSLRLNTITIDGDAGDDTIDISALGSAHRIVFKSNGGNDTIIGTLRAEDVIELPAGRRQRTTPRRPTPTV